MEELLDEQPKVTPEIVVEILRDKKGLDDKRIGYGNEKALNQLLAHHGIVFQPEDLKVWVSSNPYQLGEFVAYDLNEIFGEKDGDINVKSMSEAKLNIAKDPFLKTLAYQHYQRYRKIRNQVEKAISSDGHLEQKLLREFSLLNPDFWEAYFLVGKYNYKKGYDRLALNAFLEAETKEITTVPDREEVERYIRKLKR